MPCRLSPLASRRASSAASPNLLYTHSCLPILHLSSLAFKHNQKLAGKKDDQTPMLETKQNEKKKKGKHLPLTSTVSQNRWSCRKKSALDFQEEEVNPQAEQQHSPREVALPQGYKHPAKLVLKCTVSSLSIQGSPDSCLWLADLTPPLGL